MVRTGKKMSIITVFKCTVNCNRLQVDELGAEARIFPRLSAMAERLWSDPSTEYKIAERRLLEHRQR